MSRLEAPNGRVVVRMYRQGLGDCFLLAFQGNDNEPRYMLIDCGVLLGTSEGTEKMKDVARNIQEATGGHIHILVVTHEHWDHISGFYQAQEIFENIAIERVWMGWTEDPNNPLAKELGKKKKLYLEAVEKATQQIQGQNELLAEKLKGLLEFYGGLSAAKKTSDIMEGLGTIGSEDTEYCYPGGEPITIPEVDNIRIFILGPPESKKLIKKSDPSKNQSEVYLTDLDDARLDSFAFYLLQPNNVDIKLKPFDERFSISPDNPGGGPVNKFFKKYYHGEEHNWRTIDDNWSDMASELALKLDKHTNNTCLALAIEMVKSGKVLLFPGDAQVGNWLGWHELVWEVDGDEITIHELLKKTVLYKVGHHGSHNATLKAKGLELMTNSRLAAMISVDEEKAEKKKWKMPYNPLYEQLKKLCKGRIMRSDKGVSDKSLGINSSDWKTFKESAIENRLYIDYIP